MQLYVPYQTPYAHTLPRYEHSGSLSRDSHKLLPHPHRTVTNSSMEHRALSVNVSEKNCVRKRECFHFSGLETGAEKDHMPQRKVISADNCLEKRIEAILDDPFCLIMCLCHCNSSISALFTSDDNTRKCVVSAAYVIYQVKITVYQINDT